VVKRIGEVNSETDPALSKRNLETASTAAGETTIHPDLPERIRSVNRAGPICRVPTNGVRHSGDSSGRP
jgi:hypothetical protein